MRMKLTSLLGILLASFSLASGQTAQRLVVLEANSPLARTNPIFAFVETSVTNSLTTKLAQQGVAVVDRASIDKIIKEQNFQNSDRSDPDTAARIGKLLGAQHIVLVELDAASYTTHDEAESSSRTRTTGTVILKATAKMVDSQSALILAAPESSYTDSVLVAEKSKSNGVQLPYGFKVPAKNSQTGGDPQVIQTQEWTKAPSWQRPFPVHLSLRPHLRLSPESREEKSTWNRVRRMGSRSVRSSRFCARCPPG